MKSIPLDAVNYELIKLRVGNLRKGMFVAEIDRPWEDTPFLFQGFEIETDADLEEIAKYCDYVYIDLGRTQMVRVKIEQGPENSFANVKQQTSMEQELNTAQAAKHETANLVKAFHEDISFGKSVDIQMAKDAVSRCVESILRNPDAMLLLARMEEKIPHISEHAFNACVYSIVLGKLNGLDIKQLEDVGTAALLHDIGNIEIPSHILNKTTALSTEEFAIVKQHTTYGRDILMSAHNIYSSAVDVAYGHHECPDGSGYPRGVLGNQISQNCKIVSVVDKYVAITRNAPYRTANNHLDTVNILNILADTNKIDKQLCSCFVSYLGFYPPGTIVGLSSGEVAVVLKSNFKYRTHPQLLVVRNSEGAPIERIVDLIVKPNDDKGKPYKIKAIHPPGYLGIDVSLYHQALIHAYDG